ncbi:MAG: hypothetical protein PHE24_00865 [Patescibacteria group bacterium]|nr:hypothetical protein [Patescibacteria group bacterium]
MHEGWLAFSVLCIGAVIFCIAYNILKARIIPWSGGVMLVKEDGGYIPIDFSKYMLAIGDTVITGIFLPGAHAHSVPDVHIRALTKDPVYYSRHIEKDGGVYVMFNQPIKGRPPFLLDVTSAYPWKGKPTKDNPSHDGYYQHIEVRAEKPAY